MEQQLILVLATGAVVLSVFALLISLGTAARVSRMPTHSAYPGLQTGQPVAREPIAKVTSASTADAVLEGPSAVIFAKSRCGPCQELLAALRETDLGLSKETTLVVDTTDDGASSDVAAAAGFACTVIRDRDHLLRNAFRNSATPTTYIVAGGVVHHQIAGPDAGSIQRSIKAVSSSPLAV